ncbi:cobalamin biosynthesis protein CobG [Janibacter alittae]|uniref:Cobalamin biosynthesis protein CobG n=1 Tax=Janibacter alittae TaxID=3115209 RepID=A0ABZ2MK77_9MICO
MTTSVPSRGGADRCPGLLTPFVAEDGAMVRLRVPGGRLEAQTLAEIASLATRFGDPNLTLTSRGSLQVRGLPTPLPRQFIAAIDDLGLIPSGPHDTARNIVADPDARLDDLVADLDAALLADPALAGLPGRFLLAVARPGGPVLAEPWDVGIVDDAGSARVVVDGRCVQVPRGRAAPTALEVARRFLAARADARTWNVRDLPEDARADLLPAGIPFVGAIDAPPAPGPLGDDLVALVPLGLLTPDMAASLTGMVRLTPWRSIVVPGGAAHVDELEAAGYDASPDSPWTVLTACAGAPSCGRTTTRTRDLAREAASVVDVDGPPVHVIGCERACGHPARGHTLSLNPTTAADVVAAQSSPRDEKDP